MLRNPLLGAFAKLRKATVSFFMSGRPSAQNNSAVTGQIFMKFESFFFSKFRPENSIFIET